MCEKCFRHLKAVLGERAGYLWKKGALNKTTWKRRWFVLQERTLEYYLTHSQLELRGTIDLSHTRDRDCIELGPAGSFEVRVKASGGRRYHLRAMGEAPLKEWLQAIDKSYRAVTQLMAMTTSAAHGSAGS